MEQEMEMICVDSVRYQLDQYGYSKFSRRIAWKIIEGFTVIKLKRITCLATWPEEKEEKVLFLRKKQVYKRFKKTIAINNIIFSLKHWHKE